MGLGASVEKLLFLPEAHTDFLLAVIAEELGFAGVAVVIALFVWLLFRAYAIGRQAARLERPFAALVAQGIGVWIGVQAFINIGVNMGVLPTKGLTLPLLSFGGSGIVANCIALAILLRIDYENRRLLRGFTYDRDTVMITTGGTGGHVFPGTRRRREAPRARLRACSGSARAKAWRRSSCRSTASSSRACRFAACAARACGTLLLGPLRAARRVPRSARRSSAAARPTSCSASAASHRSPAALMGIARGKPLVLHDANAVAGLATRVLAHGADRILLGLPERAARTPRDKLVEWVGNPLRDAICALPPPAQRFAGRAGPLRLLVVGGSLGAQALNELVPAALARMPRDAAAVDRASGGREAHRGAARGLRARRRRRPNASPFIDDMAARYAWADFVICRGGALTVSELAAVGLGAIVVPLPGAIADEQSANAQFLVDAGAALKDAAGRR